MFARLAGLTLLVMALGSRAWAVDEGGRELLEKHFAALGTVKYSLFTPFGGPDVGVALIVQGGSAKLEAARCVGKGVETIVSQSVNPELERPPFTFLESGRQLLTYTQDPWKDGNGQLRQRGTLTIRSVAEPLPVKEGETDPPRQPAFGEVLYELKEAVDVSYLGAQSTSLDVLLWQPSQHFLNRSGRLPVKYNYVRLLWDPVEVRYLALQHLAVLPAADTNEGASHNNRAIHAYRNGQLMEASNLLNNAARFSDTYQSAILHNKSLVDGELEDFIKQRNIANRQFDEALMYYWKGEFAAALRIFEERKGLPQADFDVALRGLTLAQLKRWPEADDCRGQLAMARSPLLGDYMSEAVSIAEYQQLPDVIGRQLAAMQQLAPEHPGFSLGMARLLVEVGEQQTARETLEDCLRRNAAGSYDLTGLRTTLYGIYIEAGLLDKARQLETAALQAPLLDLAAYTALSDYQDFRAAFNFKLPDSPDRIKAPETPLMQAVPQHR